MTTFSSVLSDYSGLTPSGQFTVGTDGTQIAGERRRLIYSVQYSFDSNVVPVDVHSLGVESIRYVLFPTVPTPDITRFQRKMHRSRPLASESNAPHMRSVSTSQKRATFWRGFTVKVSPFPRSVHFRGLFLNAYGREAWLFCSARSERGHAHRSAESAWGYAINYLLHVYYVFSSFDFHVLFLCVLVLCLCCALLCLAKEKKIRAFVCIFPLS